MDLLFGMRCGLTVNGLVQVGNPFIWQPMLAPLVMEDRKFNLCSSALLGLNRCWALLM